MDNMEFQVDASKFNAMLRNLSIKNQSKAIESALRSAGNIIRKKTLSNLDAVVDRGGIAQRAAKREASGQKKRKDLRRGVRTAVFNRLDGVTVHIKGLGNDGRLKWLERGTEQRYTKRQAVKAYRGRIEATHFFTKAVDESAPLANKVMQRLILNSIKRIVRKSK